MSAAPRHEQKIPSLDGLRAVSILLVLLEHLGGAPGSPISARFSERYAPGGLGVRVFFVISGFLITGLLLGERARTGRISLPAFYLRRALRIFPAFYAYLGVVAALTLLGLASTPWTDLVLAGAYLGNFFRDLELHVQHSWSLAVEEQFYLVWPMLLVLLGNRRALWLAAAFLILAPVVRVTGYYPLGTPVRRLLWISADGIMTGCLLAGVRGWLHGRRLYQRWLDSLGPLLLPIVAAVAHVPTDRVRVDALISQTVANIAIALFIDWCTTRPATAIGRALNATPVAWVGRMSYSLYLWQQLFIVCHRDRNAWYNHAAVSIALAFLAAWASQRFVERPFLRLKARFAA